MMICTIIAQVEEATKVTNSSQLSYLFISGIVGFVLLILKSAKLQKAIVDLLSYKLGGYMETNRSLTDLQHHPIWNNLAYIKSIRLIDQSYSLKSPNRQAYFVAYMSILYESIETHFIPLCDQKHAAIGDEEFKKLILSTYIQMISTAFSKIDKIELADGKKMPDHIVTKLNLWRYKAEEDIKDNLETILNDASFDQMRNEAFFRLRTILYTLSATCPDLMNRFYNAFKDMNGTLDFME